ncbi:MAG: hypothetical protein UY39_C0033G0004 [Candidatus Kaiserbacteria bacterium GW2011_GWC2_49_12]|uniref:Uncharacterized protein n=3 Tax=Candidatus Kaiseribacteriota TaxID=1752734 RepID=A0A0G1YSE8_9BACT|nr:MAG: hypothetical protein UY39_C0033G0004 [Candidatus Kaiserbacteria bacterium GW2011_GWC2_49_12]KKW17952.1 MAG: hypothetical protein UY57_C0005G0002 [Candidatus Kaiserbacteria bacterium GW2011_GWB1_50_17]KKW18657.1 MAG: hypothetical protein UY59_C0001G0028 [Candidatus Kaiserbacteria bacterium GW2011_GWA1_50_28]HCM43503.1 hypothetical protein [Candidatus Kaiserbacteria bacterium]
METFFFFYCTAILLGSFVIGLGVAFGGPRLCDMLTTLLNVLMVGTVVAFFLFPSTEVYAYFITAWTGLWLGGSADG